MKVREQTELELLRWKVEDLKLRNRLLRERQDTQPSARRADRRIEELGVEVAALQERVRNLNAANDLGTSLIKMGERREQEMTDRASHLIHRLTEAYGNLPENSPMRMVLEVVRRELTS